MANRGDRWTLRRIRERLRCLGLYWREPDYPPKAPAAPVRGRLDWRSHRQPPERRRRRIETRRAVGVRRLTTKPIGRARRTPALIINEFPAS